jgi:predicted Zn-dependent protease
VTRRRNVWAAVGAAVAVAIAVGCATALPARRPEPAPPAAPGAAARAPELLQSAAAEYARRPDVAAVRRAQALYLQAAAAEPSGIAALVGAVDASTWLAEHEADARARGTAIDHAIEAARRCTERAPDAPACDYGLALALGLQARERPSTAVDGLKLMVTRLRRAEKADPRLDRAGPSRVLALVLAKAPGWPLGPGDPDAAVGEAKKAVSLFPDHAPNQLAVAEALLATGAADDAHAAAEQGLTLARARAAAGDPDAADWIRDGERLRKAEPPAQPASSP